MRRTRLFYVALFCIAVAATGSIAHAVEANPCSKDIATFCKDAKPENDGILNCLNKNDKNLSKACREYKVKLAGADNGKDEVLRAKSRKTKFPY